MKALKYLLKKMKMSNEGSSLLKFNKKQIENHGYESVIPIIVTNSADFEDVFITEERQLDQESQLLTIIKK